MDGLRGEAVEIVLLDKDEREIESLDTAEYIVIERTALELLMFALEETLSDHIN